MISIAAFRAPYSSDDAALAAPLLASADLAPDRERKIDALATILIEAIREGAGGIGGVEEVLREYSLSTKEGLALMVLAEALLRVPDAATQDRLIEDKIGQGDFAHHESRSDALLVNASAWALGITARIIQPGEQPDGILRGLAKRIGLPTVRGRHATGDAHHGRPFRPRRDDRRRAEAGGIRGCAALSLFLRHAGRRGAHSR